MGGIDEILIGWEVFNLDESGIFFFMCFGHDDDDDSESDDGVDEQILKERTLIIVVWELSFEVKAKI